jgi:Family of unknown function (DUF6496)
VNSTNFGSVTTPVGSTEKQRRLIRKYASGGDAKLEKTFKEWKAGTLHSGSKKGPIVTNRRQAIAIALNQQRRYNQAKGGSWWAQLQQEIADMGPSQGALK